MNNLFRNEDACDIVVRLSQLTPTTKSLWGKMLVAQMLAHCKAPLQVALGEKQLNRTLIGWLFGWLAKNQMLSEKPLKKNLPTDAGFIVKDTRDFTVEIQELESLIQRFAGTDPDLIAKKSHPFFGKMTPEEWGTLSWKHLDHHLRQFGV